MRIFPSYGSKERLFEMMKGVNRINEELLPPKKKEEIVNDFVGYVNEKLGLSGDIPNIKLSANENDAQKIKSYGRYIPETNELLVIIKNRNLGDILRTIAHELIHHKQRKDDKLKPNSGETGSEEENEANALAGVLMREYGKNNPIIFE